MILYNYLIQKGCLPKRKNQKEAWFISPLRKEKTASFKVLIDENVWYDHGEQIGGGFVDLLRLLNDENSAKDYLSNFSVSSDDRNSIMKEKVDFRIVNTLSIEAPRLREYIEQRKISIYTANYFCEQVNYLHGSKSYYSIGFPNDEGGYELRNSIFKNCIGKKSITHIRNHSEQLVVFEGFFDFLSFIELFPKSGKLDFLILNSIGLYRKAKPVFNDYQKVHLYLDNDLAGDKISQQILIDFSYASDCRELYKDYKDLNEFLISKNGGTQ